MKEIVLTGGFGTCLYPIRKGVSKQLLSLYDKVMVCYYISAFLLAGIHVSMIISTLYVYPGFRRFGGDRFDYGVYFEYVQSNLFQMDLTGRS